MAANPMGKARKATDPYLTVVDDRVGFTYRVLKAYAKDPDGPFARWFCVVTSPYTSSLGDMGDCYIREVTGRIVQIDPSVPVDALPHRLRVQLNGRG